MDSAVRVLVADAGWAASWAALDTLVRLEPALQADAHVVAHGLGHEAYRQTGSVAGAFARCSPAFWSGCYHGALQAHLAPWAARGGDIPAAELETICQPLRGGEAWLWFQCLHGLGHGVTIAARYDLPRALSLCDRLGDPWAREICYGGVFMEDWVGRQPTHGGEHHGEVAHIHAPPAHAHPGGALHGARAAAAPSAHHAAAHPADHSAPAAEPASDTSDLAYPCSAVGARYRRACYLFQTSRVLARTGGDFPRAAAFCAAAPEDVRPLCFQSLGRDADAYGGGDLAVQARCEGAGDGRAWCHVGAAKNRVHDRHDPRAGLAYCEALPPDEPLRALCGAAVGEEVRLFAPPERRGPFCASADPTVARGCRFAAGIDPDRPAALPRYPVRP